jgi:hypothetical protein
LTVAGFLFVNGGHAFTVRPPVTVTPTPSAAVFTPGTATHSRLAPLYFTETSGGMEELQELTEAQDKTSPLYKQVRKAPSFWKLAGYATIPVSSALGFGLVPSRRLAARAAGAIVTGVAGAVGKSRLDAISESAAMPAIAQVLIDQGLEDPVRTAGFVKEVADSFGIADPEEFETMCADVYSKYLMGMIKYNPIAKTSEIKELDNLKTALSLSNLQVGEAHAAAAAEWYRQTCLFTPEEDLEDPDNPDRQAMDKLLFLTERALRQAGETPEAFKFEMTRVAKALNLGLLEAMERVDEVAEPFYQRALKSTRAKLGTKQVSSAMLERAQKTLGIDETTAADMHIACFNEEVKAQLGLLSEDDDEDEDAAVDASSASFKEGAKERVSIAPFQSRNNNEVHLTLLILCI